MHYEKSTPGLWNYNSEECLVQTYHTNYIKQDLADAQLQDTANAGAGKLIFIGISIYHLHLPFTIYNLQFSFSIYN